MEKLPENWCIADNVEGAAEYFHRKAVGCYKGYKNRGGFLHSHSNEGKHCILDGDGVKCLDKSFHSYKIRGGFTVLNEYTFRTLVLDVENIVKHPNYLIYN